MGDIRPLVSTGTRKAEMAVDTLLSDLSPEPCGAILQVRQITGLLLREDALVLVMERDLKIAVSDERPDNRPLDEFDGRRTRIPPHCWSARR